MPFWTRRRYFFFAVPELGFKWCLAVSHALPRKGLRFRLLQARLRHVFCLCTGALFFFLGGSKGAVLAPPNVRFCGVPDPVLPKPLI